MSIHFKLTNVALASLQRVTQSPGLDGVGAPASCKKVWRDDYNEVRPHIAIGNKTPILAAKPLSGTRAGMSQNAENSSFGWPSFGEHYNLNPREKPMRMRSKIFSKTVAMLLATATPLHSEEFISATQAAKLIVDGRPWTATLPEGRTAQLTFNPDGTGSFEGPMTLSARWAVNGEQFCVTSLAGRRCLRFKPIKNGLQAYDGDAVDLRLVR